MAELNQTSEELLSETENANKLLKYLNIALQHKLTVFRTTLVGFVVSVVISLLLPPTYSSTARILPPSQRDNGILGLMMGQAGASMAGVANDLLGKGTIADMYASILATEAIMDKIIDRFKLMELYKKKYRMDTYKTLDKKIKIKAGKKDGIIVITVMDESPQRAAAIANAFVEELDAITVNLNIFDANRNKIFLAEQLSKAKVKLIDAEEQLRLFQTKNKMLDVSEQAKGTIKGIAELEGALALEEVKLEGLKRIFTENSTEVKNQHLVVTNLKKQITKLEGGAERKGAIPSIGAVPDIGQEYVRLMRGFKTQETLVDILTKQYELTKINEANSVPSIQVIQKAMPPDKKIKPSRRLIVIFCTMAAFLGSISYFDLLDRYRTLSPDQKIILDKIHLLFSYSRKKSL